MAPPEYLTIRNLSPHTLTILNLDRFAFPTGTQLPILKNWKFFSGLVDRFKKLPENAKIAPGAQAFHTEQVQIQITPFSTLDGSQIKLLKDGPNEILRITFTTNVAGRWSVDLNPHSDVVSKELVRHANPEASTEEDYTATVWHISQSHLALVWTPPLNKWQSVLPQTLPLSAFSTPGTHNSPTHYFAAPSVRCQAHSVAIQLANGIRFFDIRAQPEHKGKGNNAWLVHGKFPISLVGKHLLTSLFDDVYKFLAANLSEVVMISLKREGPFDVPDETFSRILHEKIIAPHAANWYTDPEIPTLQQAKGKCVLIRRFNLHPEVKNWGIDANSWRYNTPNDTSPSGKVQVQDFSEVLAPQNVSQKIGYVEAHIARAGALNFTNTVASAPAAIYPIYLNFLSGSNFWNIKVWPEGVADKVTPAVTEYLAVNHDSTSQVGDNGTGVLVADYVGDEGWNLMKLIVAMNGVVVGRQRNKTR